MQNLPEYIIERYKDTGRDVLKSDEQLVEWKNVLTAVVIAGSQGVVETGSSSSTTMQLLSSTMPPIEVMRRLSRIALALRTLLDDATYRAEKLELERAENHKLIAKLVEERDELRRTLSSSGPSERA